jgi:hypothetical protein
MEKKIIFIFVFVLGFFKIHAQKFPIDTLLYHGHIDRYINFVFMGDGYTAAEQDKFIKDANNIINYMFGLEPWKQYKNYCNAFAIKVVSKESGATHPNTATDCNTANVPVSNPDTYFKCSFDVYDIHRLIVPRNISNIYNVLSSNFPKYDQVILISNSPYYGGSGGDIATLTTDRNSADVATHEVGHSFARLADEYWAGDFYAAEKVNMTQEKDPAKVKWANWIGHNGIGIYQHCCTEVASKWYRPHQNCKMRSLNVPFCSVCVETIIERIHTLTNPIVQYSPTSGNIKSNDSLLIFKLTELIKPDPNTLKIVWDFDGNPIAYNTDSVTIDQSTLATGSYLLSTTVSDTTALVRSDAHNLNHFYTVIWNIEKSNTSGTKLTNIDNKISIAAFPNPTMDYIHLDIAVEKTLTDIDISIVSINGALVKMVSKGLNIASKYEDDISLIGLPAGSYILQVKGKGINQSLPFQKN